MSFPQDQLSDWIRTPVPETLWHYTSSVAAASILRTERMWATDVLFMNDRSEFVHAQGLAFELIERLPEITEHERFVKDRSEELLKSFFASGSLSKSQIQVFTLSFTTLKDSLSQWARYGDNSRGLALGLRLHGLRPSEEDETLVVFSPAIYDNELKRALLSAALQKFTDTVFELLVKVESLEWTRQRIRIWRTLYPKKSIFKDRSHFDEWNNERSLNTPIKRAAANCAKDMLHLCGLCKHNGFSEEHEWRLVLPLLHSSPRKDDVVKYRERKGKQIPYLHIALTYPPSLPFPVTEIMLGPGFTDSQIRNVDTALVNITRSDIPLVVDD